MRWTCRNAVYIMLIRFPLFAHKVYADLKYSCQHTKAAEEHFLFSAVQDLKRSSANSPIANPSRNIKI
jgi:hypothetical protein